MLRFFPLMFLPGLPGCGLIAGLRTDYELADGSIEAGVEASVGSEAGGEAGTCANMMKDGLETDIDCGGGICPKCAINKDCKDAGDCESNNCNSSGKCRP